MENEEKQKKSTKKRRNRKKGKWTPIIWILTGALMAFFISFSNDISKNKIENVNKPKLNLEINKEEKKQKVSLVKTNTNAITKNDIKTNLIKTDEVLEYEHKIYLAKETKDGLILTEKKIKSKLRQSPLNTLNELISYRGEDYFNLIPIKTEIKELNIKGDIAYLNLSDDFNYNTYGVIGYKTQIYQIVYTLTQFKNIKAVFFYVNGKPLKYLGGDGYIVNNPVYPLSTLPKFLY